MEPEQTDTIITIETNIDDTDGERLGYLMEQLLEYGALDVTFTSIQMKKNRPGIKISVMAEKQSIEALSNLLFKETGTLGLRLLPVTRLKCQRKTEMISTQWGDVRIKTASWQNEIVNIKPEYEDCRQIAKKHNISLQTVRDEAKQIIEKKRFNSSQEE